MKAGAVDVRLVSAHVSFWVLGPSNVGDGHHTMLEVFCSQVQGGLEREVVPSCRRCRRRSLQAGLLLLSLRCRQLMQLCKGHFWARHHFLTLPPRRGPPARQLSACTNVFHSLAQPPRGAELRLWAG